MASISSKVFLSTYGTLPDSSSRQPFKTGGHRGASEGRLQPRRIAEEVQVPLELTLAHKAGVQPLTIAINEQRPESFTGTVWSQLDLPPGQHVVIVVTSGTPPQTIRKVVEIPSGGVARVEVQVP